MTDVASSGESVEAPEAERTTAPLPGTRGSRVFALISKEFWSLLVSPVSWILFALLYLFRGFEVSDLLQRFARAGDVDSFPTYYLLTASTQWMVVMVPPILTMRTLAEEKRSGSLELLMTAPVRDWEVVFSKWFATWLFYVALWVPSFAILLWLQATLDVSFPIGQIATSYLGLLLVGSMLLAVGVFTSSLTDNQLLASLSSILFAVGLLSVPGMLAGRGAATIDSGFGRMFLEQANVVAHWQYWFFRGLVDTGHVVFYVSATALFLFLTVRVVESRKWR
ncbi:MAG: ABC transporter permease [Planctomycetes bacterium]|nr:ABC transporter permease [Planctomycetota bacterium]